MFEQDDLVFRTSADPDYAFKDVLDVFYIVDRIEYHYGYVHRLSERAGGEGGGWGRMYFKHGGSPSEGSFSDLARDVFAAKRGEPLSTFTNRVRTRVREIEDKLEPLSLKWTAREVVRLEFLYSHHAHAVLIVEEATPSRVLPI